MITFRAHVVTLIACLFFLAVGIALGAGPLKENVDQTLTSQVGELRQDNQDLRQQVTELERAGDYREAFDGRIEPVLTAGQLQDVRVALVALPGASSEVVGATRDSLRTAGANVPATVSIDERWVDGDQGQVLDTLASELVSEGTTLPDGDGYDRGAALLAGALVSPEPAPTPTDGTGDGATASPTPSDEQTAVLAALTEAGLVAVEGDAAGTAQLAVVVAGAPLTGDDAGERNDRLLALPRALDTASQGVVVAGELASAEGDGVVAQVRGDDGVAQAVSTVDVANLVSGRIATVFALLEQAAGGSGQYGAVGQTDGPLPANLTRTTP